MTAKTFITYLLVFIVTAFSAAVRAEKIGKITFEQMGPNKLSQEVLEYNLQSKSGNQFDPNVLNKDIKRLHSTGFFKDVVSETVKTPEGKVDIIIKVYPQYKIKQIIFKGNKKFDTVDLTKQISLVADVPLDDNKLRTSTESLRKYYQSKGYYDAKVTPMIKEAGEGFVDVIFDIKENLRLKINDVNFIGNTVYSNWDLKTSIANQHSFLSWLLDIGLLNRDELQNDKIRLRDLYWNKGYLDFKVTDIKIDQDPGDPEYANLTFTIFEGEPYKVGKITIVGNEKFSGEELRADLLLKPGGIYDNRLERKDVDAFNDRYNALGFAEYYCQVIRIPDYKTHTVDIEYRMKEGAIYTVHDVNISGNTITKDKVIRRELAIQPGDPVDKNRIETSKSRLMGMGYFEDVDAVAVASGEPNTKNVDFNVKEKDTAHLKLGGGFSDSDSLLGMVELSQNNFDITDPGNYFRGGGQRARAQVMFGLDRMDANVNFTEPWLLDMPLKLDVTGYMNEVIYEHWRERRIGGKIDLTKKVFDDFTSVSGGYKFGSVRVYKMDDWLTQDFLDEEGTDLVGATSLGITRDTRDSMMEPTTGYLLNFFSEATSQAFGASNNYYRLESKASQYFNWKFWGERMLIFHFGGKLGTISNFNNHGEVPIYERYFLGGGESLRGFPYRSVSSTVNVAGDEIPWGGQSMMIMTTEITHPIYEFIRGAVFCDIGNAWKNSYTYSPSLINMGAGYGLRIKVPYVNAPVKLDLAYPIMNNVDGLDKKFRFHFNMGFTW